MASKRYTLHVSKPGHKEREISAFSALVKQLSHLLFHHFTMAASTAWITDLQSILEPWELFASDTQLYSKESKTWAAHRYLRPKVLVRPQSTKQLSRVLAYLNNNNLKFAVRASGVASSSAEDVLISLAAFNTFDLDQENETITIGAGQPWGDVDSKLEKEAPGYAGKDHTPCGQTYSSQTAALSTRCSFVSVGGAVVSGGISWATSQFGMASDPHIFLDAHVVTVDGRVLWASEEPELLWALRGGGGGFGGQLRKPCHLFISSSS